MDFIRLKYMISKFVYIFLGKGKMADNPQLSVYELGIIKNSLRDRMVSIEELKTELVTTDSEVETNNNLDIFGAELMSIKDKIRVMIDNENEN